MGDLEQEAIDALRAAGRDDLAHAVEALRAGHKATMDAYHAGQRASYQDGKLTERGRILAVLRQMHQDARNMHNYYAFAARQIEEAASRE